MMGIPAFPAAKPLDLADKALFDTLFTQYPPVVSECTFSNLFAWRKTYGFEIAGLDGYLLVISRKPEGVFIFDPIGEKDKGDVITKCFSLCEEPSSLMFIRLPEQTVLSLKKKDFAIQEDRGNFDYLYRTADLIELKGQKYDGKRNFIKRFQKNYAFTYHQLTRESIKDCFFFQEEWCHARDCLHVEGLHKEQEAVREMLLYFEELGIQGGMLKVDKKVAAVALGEALNPDTFVIHVEKANGNFTGIYQTINQLFADHEAASFKYINREQDLGVPGLCKAKESYHPCRMIKKYFLTLMAS